MIIHTYEIGGRGRACADYLYEREGEIATEEVIILPIPTTRDKKYLKDSDIPLEDIVKMARTGVFVIGYMLPFHQRLDVFCLRRLQSQCSTTSLLPLI